MPECFTAITRSKILAVRDRFNVPSSVYCTLSLWLYIVATSSLSLRLKLGDTRFLMWEKPEDACRDSSTASVAWSFLAGTPTCNWVRDGDGGAG